MKTVPTTPSFACASCPRTLPGVPRGAQMLHGKLDWCSDRRAANQSQRWESVTRALPGPPVIRVLKHSMSNRNENQNTFVRPKFRARQHLPPENASSRPQQRTRYHSRASKDCAVPWPLRRCQQGFSRPQYMDPTLNPRTLPHENRRRCTTSASSSTMSRVQAAMVRLLKSNSSRDQPRFVQLRKRHA